MVSPTSLPPSPASLPAAQKLVSPNCDSTAVSYTSSWEPLPLDGEVARAYGRLYATMPGSGRASRRRFADLLIAATALAHGLPLFTRNPADFSGLEDLIRINAL